MAFPNAPYIQAADVSFETLPTEMKERLEPGGLTAFNAISTKLEEPTESTEKPRLRIESKKGGMEVIRWQGIFKSKEAIAAETHIFSLSAAYPTLSRVCELWFVVKHSTGELTLNTIHVKANKECILGKEIIADCELLLDDLETPIA